MKGKPETAEEDKQLYEMVCRENLVMIAQVFGKFTESSGCKYTKMQIKAHDIVLDRK
jgi:hypothetical protein